MRKSVDHSRLALLAFTLPWLMLVGCGDSPSTPATTTASSAPSGPPSGGGYGGGGYGGGGYGGGDGYGSSNGGGNESTDTSAPGDEQSSGDGSQADANAASPGYGGYGNDPYASSQAGGSTTGYQDAYGGYGAPGAPAGGISFTAQIEPILRANCYNCHGPEGKPKGDIRLDSADEITASGSVAAGRPDESELLTRVSLERGAEGAMPPKGPGLRPEEVELIRTWISSGANFVESGYADGGYGGYGAPGGGGYGAPGGRGDGRPQPPPPPKTLAEFASREFSRGNDRTAMHYLFAQAIAKSEDAGETLKKYRWAKALKRPVLAVRWGIGVTYDESSSITGGPRPIGVNQDLPGGDRERVGGGGRDAEGFDEEAVYGDFKNAALDYYAGALGGILAERLQMRIERGYYGEVLKEQITTALASGRGDDENEDRFGGYGGGSSGDGYGGRGGSSGGYGGYGGGGAEDEEDEPEDKIEQLMPGVTMLGAASLPELLRRAHEQGVDALVVFDVNVEKNMKARLYNNNTKARLYDVASEKMLVATKALNNVVMQKAFAKDPEDDTINLEFDKIFAVADEDYRCVEIPQELQAKHVVQRVKNLMDSKDDNPLWKLSEVCFYRSRDFLTDQQVAGVFSRMAPTQAEDLLKAKDDDQVKELVTSWIPSSDEVASRDDASVDQDVPSEDEPRRRRDFR